VLSLCLMLLVFNEMELNLISLIISLACSHLVAFIPSLLAASSRASSAEPGMPSPREIFHLQCQLSPLQTALHAVCVLCRLGS
jgi:hypothetical protein